MDRNTRRHYSTLLETNSDMFLSELTSAMKANQNDKVHELLALIEDKKPTLHCVKFYREGEDKSETLLHVAVKYEDNIDTIRRIIKICPDLLSLARETSEKYKGQTPLHISITRGDYHVTKLLLSFVSATEVDTHKKSSNRNKMINTRATGAIFANTVMMGELPLNVAALTFDEDMVEIVLDNGADLHAHNSYGDTLLHSLVKYSAIYPNKVDDVINMFNYLNDRMRDDKVNNLRLHGTDTDIYLEEDSYIWFIENDDHLSPLQLSAKLGVVEVFQYIIKLGNVYSFVSTHDGLFDVKLYDITEIDTVANQHVATTTTGSEGYGNKKVSRNIDGVSRTSIQKNVDCSPFKCSHFDYPETESILEMMFDFSYTGSSAFRIIETIPVKNIIQEKWRKLRYIYYIWGFLHLLLSTCLTVEIVIRSDVYARRTIAPNITSDIKIPYVSYTSEKFADAISWISFVFGGIFYCILVISLVIAKLRRPNAMRYIFHNLAYIWFLFVISVCLFVDFFMTRVSTAHDNIALILAIISGWWFAVFFLRAIQVFSFFTEMIRRVIIGDLFRFAVIISFMLIAFTAAMYAVFVGKLGMEQHISTEYASAIKDNFGSYGDTMMTMFKLMLGLGDIEVLNNARIPGLAIALYVVFALLTYVLLINSLIAMMSQTCAVVLEDRYPQWRLQQLSVSLFLEDLFCLPCIRHTFGSPGTEKEIRGFDPVTKQTKIYSRYFLTIHSLQTTYASEEDKEAMKKTSKELERPKFDGTLRSDDTPLNYFLSSGRLYPMPSVRRSNTIKNRISEIEGQSIGDVINDDNKKRIKRKKSARHNRQLSRVLEEETIRKQAVVKLGSEPDSIRSEKSPETRRRRYHSENMHEKENRRSPHSMASLSNENVNADGPLTPVDLKLHVHNHSANCPEIREQSMPNGHSHVDIEPYPHSHS